MDKNNYEIMCLRNDIPFYQNNNCYNIYKFNDVDIVEEIGGRIEFTFCSVQNNFYQFYIDFMMTALNDDETYKKFYEWDDEEDEPFSYNKIFI